MVDILLRSELKGTFNKMFDHLALISSYGNLHLSKNLKKPISVLFPDS